MYITIETLLTAAAVLAAAGALLAYYNRAYDWLRRQKEQDAAIAELKAELSLLTHGVLACLKGLREQGCNGPVTEAIQTIEADLNRRAHS